MSVPSYLSTFLWPQLQHGVEAFVEKFPGDWLVWEPGHWSAPAARGLTLTLNAPTPKKEAPRPSAHGDVLCFHLGKPGKRSVSVGREPSNDLVVSDGTVSRHHATLVGQGAGWLAKPVPGRALTVSGVAVPEGGLVLLPGKVLSLGGVELSFHDAHSLLRRFGATAA